MLGHDVKWDSIYRYTGFLFTPITQLVRSRSKCDALIGVTSSSEGNDKLWLVLIKT